MGHTTKQKEADEKGQVYLGNPSTVVGAHDKLMEARRKEQLAPWIAENPCNSIGFQASAEFPRQSGKHVKEWRERIRDQGNRFET